MLPWRREGGEVFAFGNPWRPERMLDEHVHFWAGQCVHDRHMNQASAPPYVGDDGIWPDSGLIVPVPGTAGRE
jgi:uncharacterized protein YukJ